MLMLDQRIKKICDELSTLRYSRSVTLEKLYMLESEEKSYQLIPSTFDEFSLYNNCIAWNANDKHCWVKTEFEVSEDFSGKQLILEVTTGREGEWDATNPQSLLYINGNLIQGLDVNHREVLLTVPSVFGEKITIALFIYSGIFQAPTELKIMLKVKVLETSIEKLYYDIKVPIETALMLEKDDKKRIDIINYLNNAVNMLDLRKPYSENFYTTLKAASEYLENDFYNGYCGAFEATASCIGHTHIDVAWLWTLSQTREKVVRSFSTVLNLMEQYPEYLFMSSQPQLYKFIKEESPELYEKIKQRISEGRWEPEGAMWLEADCNLISGESLVRQILFGTRFFKNEFNAKNEILWLPDVFGYSAALPQILKKSGINYFMTSKISWNEYNQLPYDTFTWKGLDGTEILTHFLTTRNPSDKFFNDFFTTYNGNIIPSQIVGAWKRYQQKNINDDVLVSYGFGDGGGGPTKEMLENARRLEKAIPGCPKVVQKKALDYFNELSTKVSSKKYLPKWSGELYLEYHRGTYTSMARNKKYNRKCEFLLQDLELLSSFAKHSSNDFIYPQEELNDLWETVLLNQFHDILPGSSIKQVYEDSKKQYEAILSTGIAMQRDAISSIISAIKVDEPSIVVFNTTSFQRNEVIEVIVPKSNTSEIISVNISKNNLVEFFAQNVPAKGYKVFPISALNNTEFETHKININDAARSISTAFYDISFDENANISSIFDKTESRQILKSDRRGNVLQAFEDKPLTYDAWDINMYYNEKMWEINDLQSFEIIKASPYMVIVKITKTFMDSKINQDIIIYSNSRRIDFNTTIDWKEKQTLLKAAFPVDLHSDKATFDIQFGNVERPTHMNTSWDSARFEVCAHKWADLSEDNFGVALLNDCKYGYDINEGVIRLTLLKSAIDPNPEADKEIHTFTYSLLPHSGNWKAGDVVREGYSLNSPLIPVYCEGSSGYLSALNSMVTSDSDNVIIEVVKKAEDSNDLILRVFECHNRRTSCTIKFFKELQSVVECDLMENELLSVIPIDDSFSFEILPYEIKTFKLS